MKTYFAAFIPEGETWSVLFADFELATQGGDVFAAFSAATEALSGRVKAMLEDGETVPEPSDAAHARKAIADWCKEEGLSPCRKHPGVSPPQQRGGFFAAPAIRKRPFQGEMGMKPPTPKKGDTFYFVGNFVGMGFF